MQCAGCNDVLMQWKIMENYSQMFRHKLWDSAIYVNMTIWLSISLTWTRLLSTGRLMMLSRECLWVLESISSCLAWATTFWGLILSVIGLCRNGQEHGETLNRSNSASFPKVCHAGGQGSMCRLGRCSRVHGLFRGAILKSWLGTSWNHEPRGVFFYFQFGRC